MKKTLFIPSLIFGLFLIISPNIGSSQVHISLKYPSSFQFVPTDLWNVTILNTSSQSLTAYIIGTVKDNNQNVLLKVTSTPFIVPKGNNDYSSSTISTASINYLNSAIQQTIIQSGQIPAGSYISCVDLYSVPTNLEL